ncbi:hypothetical protein STEG23_038035 [Scotinomys teguina]
MYSVGPSPHHQNYLAQKQGATAGYTLQLRVDRQRLQNASSQATLDLVLLTILFLKDHQYLRGPEYLYAPSCSTTDQAFVTLTTNDAYAKGVLVLGSSLKQQRTTRRMDVLTTQLVSESMRKVLETIVDEVIMVDVLDSGDSAHLTFMKGPELGITLMKLHSWSLMQYSKCVFMDADTL